MRRIVLLVIAVTLVTGCVQYSGKVGRYAASPQFEITGTSWAFDDQCQYGNSSVAYIDVSCSKDLECEVYVNDVRSNYSDGLQPCESQLVAAEIQTSVKPSFLALQSGDEYFYTRRDRNKVFEVCCSYLDSDTQGLDRDQEECQVARLDAQCPEMTASGFGEVTVLSWDLYSNGTISMKIMNDMDQNITIRNVYINGRSSSIFSVPVSAYNQSPSIILAGPSGDVGNAYALGIEIEYYPISNPNNYFNSTGSITGIFE